MCCEYRIAIKALQGLTLASADRKQARPSAPLSPHTHVHTHTYIHTTAAALPVCHKFQSEATPSVMHFPAAARAVRRYHNTGKDKKKLDTCCVYSDLAAIQRAICHIFIYCTAVTEKTTAVRQCGFSFSFFLKFMQILSDWRKASYIITTSHVYFYFFVFLHLVNARIYKAEQKRIM